ncbi:hypothetical protein SSX86_017065 [Deinandra increscens subsp. villosa]|uniref:Uncharacterized protein n=1 Tax=Deinandra increscens subsp. villosa TaxID=3103831 RepID=A0AAP0GY61_9ASTR
MSGNNSYGSSWADQWDHNPDPMPAANFSKNTGGGGGGVAGKYGKKVGVKTKEVAVTGAKKVKHGASIGIQWIKDKYHKTTAQKY